MLFFMLKSKSSGIRFPYVLGAALPLCLAGCASVQNSATTPSTAPPRTTDSAPAAVQAVLDQQQRDWNEGNLDGFMLGYANAPTTRFASGDRVLLGWQQVLDRYRTAYGNRAAMGTLAFSDIDIAMMGPSHALAFGRWHLTRDAGDLHGLFSLVFHKTHQGWRIIHDHTSKSDAPQGPPQ